MAKRTLSPDERRMIGWLAAVMASYDSPDRIIRVFVRSRTNEDGNSGCRDECAKKAWAEKAELALAAAVPYRSGGCRDWVR